ncbi:MAG: SLC13 family permease [Gemmatimonadaceae bacterium]|nr:SLC13 family permease [Gemmatimonadaceae bacterium]
MPWWRHPRLLALALPLLAGTPVALAQGWGVGARALLLGATALACWLTEWTPAWLPTLLLWFGIPLLLAPLDAAFAPAPVLGWSADPVLLLFLGGFALAAAARAQGLDRRLADAALRVARGDAWRLVVATAVATWGAGMWMSNIAAAAMMLAALAPVLDTLPRDAPLRRALLLAIAMGANTGGIGTPIGTGPNAIAIAAVAPVRPIGFVEWMAFGLPLAAGLLVFTLALLRRRFAPVGPVALAPSATAPGPRARRVLLLGLLAVGAWLSEPLHGVAAWQVATLLALLLLVAGALPWRALVTLDWGTLLLIAGGLALGRLLEETGLVVGAIDALALDTLPPLARGAMLALAAAVLSALMSNTATSTVLITATSTVLIPLAWTLDPTPASAILIAVACSLGVPFAISTPPNAMCVAQGLRSRDLLVVGLAVMVAGLVVVTLTGPVILGKLIN